MQTVTIAYDDDTHVISTTNGYAGATIDNNSTVVKVTGVPSGYAARLEFDVVVPDTNGMNRKPFVDLVAGTECVQCTIPDTILGACSRTHRLPTQLVLYDDVNGVVTASKNTLILNVAYSVDAFGAFISAYADQWTKAIIKIEQDSETGYIVVTDMEGNEQEIQFDLSILRLPAANIDGIISVENLPPSATGEVITVATEADRLALTASTVQNGDVVKVTQSNLMYVVKDDTRLSSEDGWQVFRAKVSWGDIDGTLSGQQDLASALAAIAVQADWTEADSSSMAYIAHKPTLGTASALNAGTSAGEVPVLNLDGKIPPACIPSLAISEFLGTVNTKADLTSLSTAQKGDYAIVTNDSSLTNNGMWICDGVYSVINDWVHVVTPALVTSVNSHQGDVVLTKADLGLENAVTKEEGVAQWDSTIVYEDSAITNVNGTLFLSLQSNNVGHDPTDSTGWWDEIHTGGSSGISNCVKFPSIGDGTTTVFTLRHNLNSYDVAVIVSETASDHAISGALVERPSNNTVKVTFTAPPAAGEFDVVVWRMGASIVYGEDLDQLLTASDLGVEEGAEVNIIEAVKVDGTALVPDGSRAVNIDLSGKVDKVSGKVLSSNDFTDAYKTKLDAIAAGAEVNVNADWNASSGDAQILNKPTIPSALSDLSDDATHRVVTDTEKSAWDAKASSVESTITGDGTTTVFTISHTFGGSPQVSLYESDGTRTSTLIQLITNAVKLTFSTPPSVGETFKVVITR